MKKVIFVGMTLCLILAAGFVFADDAGGKAVSTEVSVNAAGEGSVFVRVGDWFAMVGKSEQEKTRIIRERRSNRVSKHAEKSARKAQKNAEKTREKSAKELKKADRKAMKAEEQRGIGLKKGHTKGKGNR